MNKHKFSMKKVKIILGLTLAMLLASANGDLYGQTMPASPRDLSVKTWDYPVKPDTKEWQAFKSIDEMYKACQIPERVLKQLDTESLLGICLNYPAYSVLFLYNTPQEGFDNLYAKFNGLRELLDRNDIGRVMLKKYASMSFADFNPLWQLEEQGRYVFKHEYFEMILAQSKVVQSLNAEERVLLLRETVKKYDEKITRLDLFGGNTVAVNVWVMAKNLNHEKKLSLKRANTNAELSLKSGLLDCDLQDIYQQTKKYVYE